MKNKKQWITLGLFMLLMLLFTACGAKEEEKTPNYETPIGEEEEAEVTATPEPTATIAPTSTQAPVAEEVKLGRLLLNLGENMKEYGTADLELGLSLAVNLTDDDIMTLKESEGYEGIEITNHQELKVTGLVASNKEETGGRFDLHVNSYGQEVEQRIEEYWQLLGNDTGNYYFFDPMSNEWCCYKEDTASISDLTDTIGIIAFPQMVSEGMYEEIDMTVEADRYLVDGTFKFRRFFQSLMTNLSRNFLGGAPEVSDDLMMKVHMEFGKADKQLKVFSLYLANPKPLTMEDLFQFEEFYLDIAFDISPEGARTVIPREAIDTAIIME